jgi:mRNA interferase RelE/StbE
VYRLEISQSAHRQVRKLPSETRERINQAIARLAEEPRPSGTKKLTGREGYRIRAGDYRILYQIDDNSKVVIIYRVMARGDVYRLR